MGLAELPDDVLLQIASTLSVQDVLALKQVSHRHLGQSHDFRHN